MPIEQSVEEFFPVTKSGKERDIIVGYIEDILKHGDKLATIREKLSFGTLNFGDSKRVVSELNGEMNGLTVTTDKYAKQLLLVSKANKEQASADAIRTKSLIEQEKELERLIMLEEKANAAKKANAEVPFTTNLNSDGTINEPTQGRTTGTTVSAENKAQVEGILTAKEYAAAQGGVVKSLNDNAAAAQIAIVTEKELQAARIKVQKANSENNVALQGYKLQQQEANKAAKEQAAQELGLSKVIQIENNSLNQAREAVKVLTKERNNLNLSTDTGKLRLSQINIEIDKNNKFIEANSDKLAKQKIGIGDYAGGIEKAFGKAFGFIRTAANILPGLGLSGAFLLIFEAIKKVSDSFGLFSEKLDATKAGIEAYNDIVKQSADNFGKAKVQVADLSEKIQLAKDGFISKSEVLKEYNDTIGKTIGHAGNLSEAEQKLIDKAPAFIKFTFLKAQAQAAGDLAAKESAKSVEASNKQLDEFVDNTDAFIAAAKAALSSPFQTKAANIADAAIGLSTKAAKEQKKEISDAELRYNKFIEFQKKALDEAATFGKKNGFDFYGGKEDAKKVKTIADAVSELRKELAAIQGKQDLGELAPKQADIDRVKAYDKAFEDIFKRGATAKTPIVQELRVELSPINQRVIEQEIKDLVAKVSGKDRIDLLPPDAETQKRFNDLRERLKTSYKTFADDEAKFNEEILQRELVAQETAALKEQKAVEDKYNAGKSSKEDYEKALRDIQLRYAKEGANSTIKYLEEEIKLYGVGTKAREDAEKRLAAARLAISKTVTQKMLEDQDELVKELGKIQAAVNGAFDVIGGLINISVTKEKNALRELEDQQQKNYDNQVTRINSSTLTDAQKADQLKILDAQRQAQKDTFDRKNREADQKKAAFDKAQAIASIILNTAVSAAKVLYDPFLLPLTLALGAAQLAIAIATPLPKYATGVMNKQFDSFGIAGEAGAERVERPGYAPIVVDKETAMFMPRGTNVIPLGSDKINGAMYLGMMQQQVKKEGRNRQEELLQSIHAELRKKKPITNNFIVRDTATYQRQKQKYYGQA